MQMNALNSDGLKNKLYRLIGMEEQILSNNEDVKLATWKVAFLSQMTHLFSEETTDKSSSKG